MNLKTKPVKKTILVSQPMSGPLLPSTGFNGNFP